MKSLIIFLVVIIFSINNGYSKEPVDCKKLKKFSMKSATCKTTNSLSTFKNKLSKKRELKNKERELKKEAKKKSSKKSIFKKFKDAKTLKEFEADLK